MTEPALTHRLILLQMRQALCISQALDLHHYQGCSQEREAQFEAAKSLLEQAENLVRESEQEERSDADVWEETCQVVRPQA